jgi:hypothetical protein
MPGLPILPLSATLAPYLDDLSDSNLLTKTPNFG